MIIVNIANLFAITVSSIPISVLSTIFRCTKMTAHARLVFRELSYVNEFEITMPNALLGDFSLLLRSMCHQP